MLKFISEGGWGIFPVLLFGLTTVGVSLAFAVSLRRELLPLLVGFGVATLLMGGVGSVVGVQSTLRSAALLPAFDAAEVAVGVRESLNVLLAALDLSLLATLVCSAGGFRLAWRGAARD